VGTSLHQLQEFEQTRKQHNAALALRDGALRLRTGQGRASGRVEYPFPDLVHPSNLTPLTTVPEARRAQNSQLSAPVGSRTLLSPV